MGVILCTIGNAALLYQQKAAYGLEYFNKDSRISCISILYYYYDFFYYKGISKILPRTTKSELSGAKFELQGVTVNVCSFHKRGGQPPYNLPAAHLRCTPRILQVCLLAHFNK